MTRRILPLLALVAVVGAACGPADIGVTTRPAAELGFIPQVVDVQGDAGAGVSLAIDGEGNPHLAYLSLERELAEGERVPAPDPTLPLFPAVRHAHFVGGVWTKTIVAEELEVTEDDTTAIAVDADGVHHVAWTQGAEVLYANNAPGEFDDPASVMQAEVAGLAIAAGDDGTPWISAYELVEEAEGPAALVRAATPVGDAWEVETAAEAEPQEPMTTGIGVAGDQVVVAYGSGSSTLVARSGEVWESEEADADGGLGVSMDLDADRNPHLAYYTAAGGVRHAHSIAGSPWETSDVGDAGAAPEPGWITSISLAEDGTHWVAWQAGNELAASTNAGGSFEPVEVRSSAGGTRPQIGAGADEDVYLGWYASEERTLNVSVRTDREPLLAGPPAEPEEPAPGPADEEPGPPPCLPDGTELRSVAAVGATANGFEEDCLAAPVGEMFTIEFDNQDEGVPHNVAIYTDETAAEELFVGEVFPGSEVMTYDVDPIDEPGQYFYRCDVHPTTMTGPFVVE